MHIAVAAVALAQLIALVLWIKPRKLQALWPTGKRSPAPELPSSLAPLLEEIAQLRREIRDERLARAAGLAAERFAAHRAMRIAAESSRPPLLAVVTDGDRSVIEIPLPLVRRASAELDDGEITEAEQTRVRAPSNGRPVLSIVGGPPPARPPRSSTASAPPHRPLAFPDALIGSEDIPDEVATVLGPGSGLGPDDDTPPLGIRGIRATAPQ